MPKAYSTLLSKQLYISKRRIVNLFRTSGAKALSDFETVLLKRAPPYRSYDTVQKARYMCAGLTILRHNSCDQTRIYGKRIGVLSSRVAWYGRRTFVQRTLLPIIQPFDGQNPRSIVV